MAVFVPQSRPCLANRAAASTNVLSRDAASHRMTVAVWPQWAEVSLPSPTVPYQKSGAAVAHAMVPKWKHFCHTSDFPTIFVILRFDFRSA